MAKSSVGLPRLPIAAIFFLACLWTLCSVPTEGLAQTPTTATWNGGTGNWSTAGNWAPGTVPNGNYDVFINNAPSAVTFDSGASPGTIADLTLGTGNSLTLATGTTLTVNGVGGAGTITNNGAISLNAATLSPGTGSLTLTGSGTLTLSSDGSSVLGGPSATLINDTSHTIQGAGIVGGLLTNSGTITANQSNALTLYVAGSSANSGTIQSTSTGGLNVQSSGAFTNSGNILAAGGPVSITGVITNNGTLGVASGSTMNMAGATLTNYSSNTLTGGTYNVTGTLALPVPTLESIQTNAATIVLNGPSAAITRGDGSNALSGFNTNASGGSFTIKNGANFTTAGAFNNAGTMTFGTGSTFAVGGGAAYTQTGGNTTVNDALTAGSISIQGGLLNGAGAITGGLTVGNVGTLHPGNSPGVLTVNGNYVNTGTLAIDILNLAGGPGTGYSQLVVNSSTVTILGGTLQINVLTGAVMTQGDKFDILHATGGLSGTFASVTGDSSHFYVDYESNDVYLVATPIPPGLFLLSSGLVGLYGLRKRIMALRHRG
jgi:hypothetical protein